MKNQPEFRIIAAGKFKATCLELMDEVLEDPTLTLIITKRGKPVAQLTAPSTGLTISSPVVELTSATHPVDLSASVEKPRKRKRKDKKKHK